MFNSYASLLCSGLLSLFRGSGNPGQKVESFIPGCRRGQCLRQDYCSESLKIPRPALRLYLFQAALAYLISPLSLIPPQSSLLSIWALSARGVQSRKYTRCWLVVVGLHYSLTDSFSSKTGFHIGKFQKFFFFFPQETIRRLSSVFILCIRTLRVWWETSVKEVT